MIPISADFAIAGAGGRSKVTFSCQGKSLHHASLAQNRAQKMQKYHPVVSEWLGADSMIQSTIARMTFAPYCIAVCRFWYRGVQGPIGGYFLATGESATPCFARSEGRSGGAKISSCSLWMARGDFIHNPPSRG